MSFPTAKSVFLVEKIVYQAAFLLLSCNPSCDASRTAHGPQSDLLLMFDRRYGAQNPMRCIWYGAPMQDWAVLRGRGRSKTNVIIHVAAASVDLWPAAVLLNNALCTVVRS